MNIYKEKKNPKLCIFPDGFDQSAFKLAYYKCANISIGTILNTQMTPV